MTLRVSPACVAVTAVAAAWAFVIYGTGRTMVQTMGPSLRAVIIGASVVSMLTLPTLVCVGLAAWLLVPGGLSRSVYEAIVAGALLGSAVSETAILVDEVRFKSDVACDPSANHHRARAWPNGSGELCYAPARGYWTND